MRTLVLLAFSGLVTVPAARAQVDFASQVLPLFAQHCVKCHGADEQKSGLRLDSKAAAFLGGEHGAVIVPGNAAESRLYRYIAALDPEIVMPPEGERLSDQNVALIKAWIDEGAAWPDDALIGPAQGTSDHWSFQPIVRHDPPAVRNAAWVRNPIDNFILARLEAEDIAPNPEANRVTLIRRLSLDLVGLPPTPAEVDEFVNDESPYAYERVVTRLLASPHFGERWGRYWLDLARYADSDGFEKDTERPHAWRYREWVINALNRDLPYDQFLIEQLAGDLLPNPTTEQLVATGFHRNTLTNKEGGVDVEQFRVEQVVDRTNTTASVFMGLTMACAQCHTHKYDPITHREYFGMYAFFNTGIEKDVPAPLDSELALYTRERARFDEQRRGLQRRVSEYRPKFRAKLPQLEQDLREELDNLTWTQLSPSKMVSAGGATFTKLLDGSILVGGDSPLVDTYTLSVPTSLENIVGFRLEVLTHDSLPKTGPGRAHHGNFILSEFHVTAAPPDDPASAQPVAFASAWTDFYEEGWEVEEAIDGNTETGWSINAWRGYNENRTAVFVTKPDAEIPARAVLTIKLDHQYGTSHAIGRFRLYAATGARDHLLTLPDIPAILAKSAEARSEAERDRLAEFLGSRDPEMRALQAALDGHTRAQPTLESTYAQILMENPEPPETHIHLRGDFLRPGDKVEPHTLAVLPPLKAQDPDRLDLAKWLTSPEHPLTSRVAANRVWERLFGRGLVETSEDFGTRGELPTHPELLDWLATEYMRQGWSTKEMIKLVVTSSTYRQSSKGRPDLLDRDSGNELLARQNRYRISAELVRDVSLAASGLLVDTIGGPSVRPPLPEGVAELGYANSVKWPESSGDDKYRRGIYVLFQRTVPYPMLMTFDCPDSNVTAIRRARSNTPLQALTLMNDPVFFECAQAMARRAHLEGPADIHERLRYLFRLCVAREPQPRELEALEELWGDQFDMINTNGDTALKIIGEYLPDGAEPQEIAPWVIVARTLMNLDEFITRE